MQVVSHQVEVSEYIQAQRYRYLVREVRIFPGQSCLQDGSHGHCYTLHFYTLFINKYQNQDMK